MPFFLSKGNMMNNLIYNIKYEAYLNLLSSIENKFNSYKTSLLGFNLKLVHPSLLKNTPLRQHIIIVEKHFYEESIKFGTSLNFLNALHLINYHLGSVLQISEIKQISSNIDSISISVEDLLIIESFKDL